MTNFDADAQLTLLSRLAEKAAEETLPRFRSQGAITNKAQTGEFDPVTDADREAERAIRGLISSTYPDHQILGEEFGTSGGQSPWRWIIDPVDGTRAFVCGLPTWTTLIGVTHEGVPRAGIIDQPFTTERWIAAEEKETVYQRAGHFHPARTSDCTTLENARLMVTDIRAGEYLSQTESEALFGLARKVKLLRQGLDSYGFGLVALGQMDLVVEAGLSWYDIAAVIRVIEGAGGTITDWQGNPVREGFAGGRVIVAATPELGRAAQQELRDVA